jgi:hypothetical protein
VDSSPASAKRPSSAARASGGGRVQRDPRRGHRHAAEKSCACSGRRPHIAAIETRLTGVDALMPASATNRCCRRRGAPCRAGPRRRLSDDFLDTYTRSRAFTPDFLGFNGPRTYLILAQNNAELLSTGGLVSVFGTVRLDHGSVEDMQFHDAVQFGEDWMARTGDYVEPPAPLKQYLLKDTSWNMTVSNWSPDFPTSARPHERFHQLGGGGPSMA